MQHIRAHSLYPLLQRKSNLFIFILIQSYFYLHKYSLQGLFHERIAREEILATILDTMMDPTQHTQFSAVCYCFSQLSIQDSSVKVPQRTSTPLSFNSTSSLFLVAFLFFSLCKLCVTMQLCQPTGSDTVIPALCSFLIYLAVAVNTHMMWFMRALCTV